MKGYAPRRPGPARTRRPALEPLEDRYLLSALGAPATRVSVAPAVPAAPARSGAPNAPVAAGSRTGSPAATGAPAPPPAGPAGNAPLRPSAARSQESASPTPDYAAPTDPGERSPARDADEGDGEGNRDESYARHAAESVVRAAASEQVIGPDAQTPQAGRGASISGAVSEQVDGASGLNRPQSVPPAPAPASGERVSPLPSHDGGPKASASPEVIDPRESSSTGESLADAGAGDASGPAECAAQYGAVLLSAGEGGVDLRAVEEGMAALFARLGDLSPGASGQSLATGLGAWLGAVAVATLEIARVGDKGRAARDAPGPCTYPEGA